MALADIFFPGNPERREKVFRLSSKLATLLESNFKRTNELIECIHRFVPGKTFSKVRVNHDESIRSNCRTIQAKLNEIQVYLDQKVGDLRRRLDPDVFNQLMSTDTKFIDKYRLARNVVKIVDLALTVGGIVCVALIAKGTILVSIAASIGVLMTATFAGLAFGVLILGLDAIISAFVGYFEKESLEETIKELENAIREFEPVSDKFNKDVERLIIRLEDLFE